MDFVHFANLSSPEGEGFQPSLTGTIISGINKDFPHGGIMGKNRVQFQKGVEFPGLSKTVRDRGAMSRGRVSPSVASGVSLSGLRSRPLLPLVGREVSMPCLSPSDLVDQRDSFRVDQAAADNLVSGDLHPDLDQECDVGVGIQAPVGGVL